MHSAKLNSRLLSLTAGDGKGLLPIRADKKAASPSGGSGF
jgi:hypothetical protein